MAAVQTIPKRIEDRVLDPSLHFVARSLQSALKLWRGKCGGNGLPSRQDFSVDDLAPYLGSIALIDVEHAPLRYRYRLIGTNITSMVQRDMSGIYLDEIYPPDAYENVTRSFAYILENREPVRGFGSVAHALKGHVNVEVLDAPLSSDGQTINMIMKFVHRGTAQISSLPF